MNKLFILLIATLLFFVFPMSTLAYEPLSVSNNIYGIGVINHSDLEDVSNLVNTNGGDWGYVKVIITEKDRNREIWQKFMNDCRKLHLIPIVRIATEFDGTNWKTPKIEDIDSWVNFFNSLNWVVENRYVVIGNEPNHAKEWGGIVNPSEYAIYLKTFSERLNNSSSDYFVLNAGLDQAAPNSKTTMDETKFINDAIKAVPNIFDYIDGWNSHSYPNPAFSGPKNGSGRKSIKGYEWELEYLQSKGINNDLPVFITETGWVMNNISNQEKVASNMKYAFENIWSKDNRIVAVTPFILNYQSKPFYEFSWKNKDNSYFPIYNEVQSLTKIHGKPTQKISGEILFNFLNPLVFNGKQINGISIIKNTGQVAWNSNNTEIRVENGEMNLQSMEINEVEPFSSGLVVYRIKTEDSDNLSDLKLGFYVQGTRIGNVFNGKIISF